MKKTVPFHVKAGRALSAALILFAMAVSLSAAPPGADVLAKLGLTPVAAGDGILEALASGTPYNETAFKAFQALPASARAAVVSAGLGWIKAYVASAEFQAAYGELRRKDKPEAPAPRPAADDPVKKMKADMENSIAQMRKGMAAMDAETRKVMETTIREMRAQMQRMESDPQQKGLMVQMAEMERAEEKKRHEAALQAWEEKLPADPRVLIGKRIADFLVMSAGVDFTAKLAPRGEQMVFVNNEYERKPPEWKLCFRAGKEATAAARVFASDWLAELKRSGI
jgi:hypothetical protein